MTLGAALSRLWGSPVLTSWGSIAVRTGGFAILLPLALAKLDPGEVAVWLLFSSLLALPLLADFGLSPTFARMIAYTQAGSSLSGGSGRHDLAGLRSIVQVIVAMRAAYLRLTCVVLFLAATVGTACLIRPMSGLDSPLAGWLAWAVVVISGTISVHNVMNVSILQGMNLIPVLRRWEIVTGLASTCCAIAALLLDFGLLGLVITVQAGWVAAAWINRRLVMRCTPKQAWLEHAHFRTKLPPDIWAASWRSGLGVAMTYGVLQASGVVYAQFGAPREVTSFLFTQRVMQAISMVVQVPFYTRIPMLSRLYAEGRRDQIVLVSRAAMGQSNWLLVLAVMCGWLLVPLLLAHIGSATQPPADALWWAMGTALLLERTGAMYLQTYSITNHIVWHVANGFAGLLMMAASAPLYLVYGGPGLALAWVVGYAFFYLPYSAYISVKAFPPRDKWREFWVNGLPVVIMGGLLFMVFL